MVKTWDQVRQDAIDAGRLDPKRVEELARMQLDRVRAYQLAQVRKALGLNQTDVATSMGISQARVSKIERGALETAQVGTAGLRPRPWRRGRGGRALRRREHRHRRLRPA